MQNELCTVQVNLGLPDSCVKGLVKQLKSKSALYVVQQGIELFDHLRFKFSVKTYQLIICFIVNQKPP